MRQFLRSRGRRRALVLACLPYLFLSVFVDFVHVHRSGRIAASRPGTVVSAPAQRQASLPDYSCAICQLQRIGTRPEPSVQTGPTSGAPAPIALLETFSPPSPIPHSSALRGPPRSIVS